MSYSNMDLSAIITEEQKFTAMEYQSEAWAGGILNGIEPEILADAAFDTALRQLIKLRSEKQALKLIFLLRKKIEMGYFSDPKVIQ